MRRLSFLVILLFFGLVRAQHGADRDRDGLPDHAESFWRTDPALADTDGDGWSDAVEVARGTDARDPSSRPSGPGVGAAVSAWAEGAAVRLTFTAASPSGFSEFRSVEARVAGSWGIIVVTPLVLSGALSAAEGVASLTVTVPRMFQEPVTVALRYTESSGSRGHQAVTLEAPSGLVASVPSGPGRMRMQAAEAPRGSLQVPQTAWLDSWIADWREEARRERECEQAIRRVSGPLHIVSGEECRDRPRQVCVADCGAMIGRQVIILEEVW